MTQLPPGQGPINPPGASSLPPASSSSSRSGWKIFKILVLIFLVGMLAFSLMANVVLLAFIGLSGVSEGRHNTVVQGNPREKVAVIPVNGIIFSQAAERFDRFMTQAQHDANVKAVVVEINTPGGEVTASDEMHHRIGQFKKDRPGVPVIVAMGSLATSGGYYLACAADDIFAQPTTMTGNIGVLLPRFNVARLFERWGIQETTIQSSGTPFKNAGSPFRPEKPEETAYLQGIADEAFRQFKDVVRRGRAGRLDKSVTVDQIANGKVYMGEEALKLGLIDRIGYPADAYRFASQKAGLKKMMVVRYEESPSLLRLLTSEDCFNGVRPSGQGSFNISGVQVNMDSRLLHDLLTPRLMYLWLGN